MSVALRAAKLTVLVALACGGSALADNHLLITEVKGSGADYIEIHNPGQNAVELSNYYVSDHSRYSRISCCPTDLSLTLDFIARFPNGASIGPGAVAVVAMNAPAHFAAYGVNPTYEMPTTDPKNPGDPAVADMRIAFPNSIGAAEIADAGEWIFLFTWNQASDLIQDVDIVRCGLVGVNDAFSGKGGECWDGPDAGSVCTPFKIDLMTMPAMTASAGAGFSYKRRYKEGTLEQHCNGNGLTDHDETTEFIQTTWDGHGVRFTAPTPGVIPVFTNPPGVCFADIVDNNFVDTDDLLALLGSWGACTSCPNCPADMAPVGCTNCAVDTDDLLAMLGSWGPCP